MQIKMCSTGSVYTVWNSRSHGFHVRIEYRCGIAAQRMGGGSSWAIGVLVPQPFIDLTYGIYTFVSQVPPPIGWYKVQLPGYRAGERPRFDSDFFISYEEGSLVGGRYRWMRSFYRAMLYGYYPNTLPVTAAGYSKWRRRTIGRRCHALFSKDIKNVCRYLSNVSEANVD